MAEQMTDGQEWAGARPSDKKGMDAAVCEKTDCEFIEEPRTCDLCRKTNAESYDIGAAAARKDTIDKVRDEVTKKVGKAIWHSGYSEAACTLIDFLDQLEQEGG